MKSQKSINRKAAKTRERRKDFAKKRNVRKNNWPTPRYKEEVDRLEPVRDEKTKKTTYKIIGKKTVIHKGAKPRLTPGDGILPKSRKVTVGKKEKLAHKNLMINKIAGGTATGK